MTDETPDPPIPTPYDIAVELTEARNKNSLSPRDRIYCDIGLMLYWAANEINNLVVILQPNVTLQVQDEAETVPGPGPEEGSEGATSSPVDADAQRQEQGSD